MGRDNSGMEDDEPIAEMPSFISSFEDGRSKVSRSRLPAETSTGDSKVERPVRGCSRVTGSTSSLSLDEDKGDTDERSSEEETEEVVEKEKEKDNGEAVEKEAKGNNNNNSNGGGERKRRRASAVDILRRNLGVVKSSSLRSNTNIWTPRDTERDAANDDDDDDGSDAASVETGEAGIEIKRTECDSETSDGDGAQFVNLTGKGDEAPDAKEHVYCTVYCIANESGGTGVTDDGTYVADEAPQMDSEAPPEVGSSPEPSLYTLEDLVDPFGDIARHLSFGQADAEATVQTCWVCLEGKSIAPLPCCKKTVCDECLKIYVTSQVG